MRARAALSVHEAHLPHLVTQLSEAGDQAHLFGDVVADQPKVDDVTTGVKLWETRRTLWIPVTNSPCPNPHPRKSTLTTLTLFPL
jgi:hypothetical protein